MCQAVDELSLTTHQKMKLFKLSICPWLQWILSTVEFPLRWVEHQLEPISTRFLKRWSGLSHCAATSSLHLLADHLGLGMPSLSTTFKTLHSSLLCQLLSSSSDERVRQLAEWKANRDINSSCYKFRASLSEVAIIDSSEVKTLQKSKKSVESQIEKGDIKSRLEHMTSCLVQRSAHHLPSMSGESIWSKVVST